MSTLELCNTKITELLYILKQETKMLRSGRLNGLDEVVRRKTSALIELEGLVADLKGAALVNQLLPQMDRLQRIAEENGLMLRSVMNGVKSARERLRALQHQHANVGAYDRRGSKVFIGEDQINAELTV